MIDSRVILLMSLSVLTGAGPRARAEVRIDSDLYSVGVEAADGRFAVLAKPSGKAFLTGGKLSSAGGTAKTVELPTKSSARARASRSPIPTAIASRWPYMPACPSWFSALPSITAKRNRSC